MDRETEERAQRLWEEGTRELLQGDVDGAVDLFTRSLKVLPTAEAYTYRGWALSFHGLLDEAILDCRKAIATDPSFGNPYNDIGCYLMQLGRPDEAIPWLEKAKAAGRYEPRHFPYLNLGRLYFTRGLVAEAIVELDEALRLNPEDPVALVLRKRLDQLVN